MNNICYISALNFKKINFCRNQCFIKIFAKRMKTQSLVLYFWRPLKNNTFTAKYRKAVVILINFTM